MIIAFNGFGSGQLHNELRFASRVGGARLSLKSPLLKAQSQAWSGSYRTLSHACYQLTHEQPSYNQTDNKSVCLSQRGSHSFLKHIHAAAAHDRFLWLFPAPFHKNSLLVVSGDFWTSFVFHIVCNPGRLWAPCHFLRDCTKNTAVGRGTGF